MNKKARLAVLLWLAAPLGACGGSDEDGSADAEPEARASAPAPRPSAAATPAAATPTAATPAAGSDPARVEATNVEAALPASDPLETPDDVASPAADAEFTPSGLASKLLSEGTGVRHPVRTDTVRVNYAGWTTDGMLFDSSYSRGRPIEFPLTRVIRGWTEGLQLMVEGERRRFWIPAELAYGTDPEPDQPAGMLVFDVELLAIVDL